MNWKALLKTLVAGLLGGAVQTGAVVLANFDSLVWTKVAAVYGVTVVASASLYWLKSPAGREIWTDDERTSFRAGKL